MTKTKTGKRRNAKADTTTIDRNFAVLIPEGARLVGALKVKDAADYLDLSKMTLVRLVERGLIRPNRATRHLLFAISELDRFLTEGQVE
jgi:excisionase family DNA binding protein